MPTALHDEECLEIQICRNGHSMCMHCVSQNIKSKLDDENICKQLITCPECRAVCDDNLIEQYGNQYLDRYKRMIECCRQENEDVVEVFRVNHVTECNTCERFAFQAKDCAAEPPNQKLMCSVCHDSLPDAALAKISPCCGRAVQHGGGCAKMTCESCPENDGEPMYWCWKCAEFKSNDPDEVYNHLSEECGGIFMDDEMGDDWDDDEFD